MSLMIKDIPEVDSPWKGRNYVGDLDVDGRLILQVILREGDVKEMEYIKLFYIGSNSRLS